MEQVPKANITDYDRKYKFDLTRISDSLRLEVRIDGPESLDMYKYRVRAELGSYYGATMILKRRNPYTESVALNCSVRSVQRYWKEFPLPDNVLEILYHIQITQL